MSERLRDAAIVLRRAAVEARDDRVALTAQALAYSLFLAIPAVFLVLLGLFSIFGDEGTVEELVDRAGAVMPSEATSLLGDSLRRTSEAEGGGVLMAVGGFLLALWTTTSAASTLMLGLTTTYDREDSRGFVRKRLLSLVLVAALAASSALVLGLLVLGPHLEGWVGVATGLESLVSWVWWTAQWPVLALGLLFAFAIVLYFGPDVDQSEWKLVTPGAVTALLAWLAASGGLAVYAAYFGSYDKTWGTLSAVIVTLVWLWLTSAALLFGAEVNAEWRRLRAERDRPLTLAVRETREPTRPFPRRASGQAR